MFKYKYLYIFDQARITVTVTDICHVHTDTDTELLHTPTASRLHTTVKQFTNSKTHYSNCGGVIMVTITITDAFRVNTKLVGSTQRSIMAIYLPSASPRSADKNATHNACSHDGKHKRAGDGPCKRDQYLRQPPIDQRVQPHLYLP